MMNLFEIGERLKDFSKNQLVQEMQRPSGVAPQFLVLSELQRRTRMEKEMAASDPTPQTSVAEEAVAAAAGVPQGGLQAMAQALSPRTDIDANSGPTSRMQEGGRIGDVSADVEDFYAGAVGPGSRAGFRWVNGRLIDPYGRTVPLPPGPRVRSRDPRSPRLPAEVSGYTRLPYMDDVADPMAATRRLDDYIDTEEVSVPGGGPDLYIRDIGMRAPETKGLPSVSSAVDPELLETERLMRRRGAPGRYLSDVDSPLPPALPGGVRSISTAFDPTEGPILYDPGALPQDSGIESMLSALPNQPVIRAPNPVTTGGMDDPMRLPVQGPRQPGPVQGPVFKPPFIAPSIGATELNLPAFRRALSGEPGAGLATPLAERSRTGEGGLGSDIMDAIRLTAAAISPFASEKEKAAAAEAAGAERTVAEVPETETAPTVRPETPPTERPKGERTGAGAGAGAGAVAGGGKRAVSDADRTFEQDKWLSLARFGLALMSSQAPTLGQAIGQAGTVGLDALQKARQSFEERRQLDEAMALRRAAAAAKAQPGLPSLGIDPDLNRRVDQLRKDLEYVDNALRFSGYVPGKPVPPGDANLQGLIAQRDALIRTINSLSYSPVSFLGQGERDNMGAGGNFDITGG